MKQCGTIDSNQYNWMNMNPQIRNDPSSYLTLVIDANTATYEVWHVLSMLSFQNTQLHHCRFPDFGSFLSLFNIKD